MALSRERVLRYAAADYGGSLLALAVTALLPVLIVAMSDAHTGGTFYVVWLIATSLNLLPTNMCASMTVEAIHSGADLAQESRRVAIHMARLLVPLVIGVLLLADWIMRVFGPEYASGGTTPLRIVAIAVLPAAVNTLYLATCRIRARGGEIVRVQAALTVLTLCGTAVALPVAGITGVAVAWLLAQLAVAAYAARRLRTLIGSDPRNPGRQPEPA
jgi:O-antigen/teichoic acid export membrane protein